MAEHAKLSASGAHRWMACPASARMEFGRPESTNQYAELGTAAHELAEECLSDSFDPGDFLGVTLNGFTVDDEMAEEVGKYVNYVRSLPGEMLVEQRVDFSPWVPDGFGTSDALVFHENTLTVIDLKYGKGLRVEAEGNPQAMLYALGAVNDYGFLYDVENVRMVIHQPRLDHLSEFEISVSDLMAWAEDVIRPAAELALSDDAPFKPSEDPCRFCKAAGDCRALHDNVIDLMTDEFAELPGGLIFANRLTSEEIGDLLPQLGLVDTWVKAVRAQAVERLKDGETVPGYKLVESTPSRRWADAEAAGEALQRKLGAKQAWVRKPIGIGQAEKLLGKESRLIAKHATRPPGAPTLAPENSPKPALVFDVGADFDDLPDAA